MVVLCFVAAIYLLVLTPLLVVVGTNIGRLPIPPIVLFRSATVGLVIAASLAWSIHRVIRRRGTRAPAWLAVTLLCLAVVWAGLAFRPVLSAERASSASYTAADGIVARILSQPRPVVPPPTRDIYVIVLDAMGRADVLRDRYGLEVADLVSELEQLGFQVPRASRSAYPQTFLSLASTLNLSPLDELIATTTPTLLDLYPLKHLIEQNALMQLAESRGYQVIVMGSDYAATDRFPLSDVCRCRLSVPHQVEHAALNLIPGLSSIVPIDAWAFEALRQKTIGTLDDLRTYHHGSPQFVFAHVLSPHPPFVFAADGSSRVPGGQFTFMAPSNRATYVEGYRGQARFVLQATVAVVKAILARPGPDPVIIVQGDHGPIAPAEPGGDVDPNERLGVFSAYYFPGESEPLPTDLSPVNGLRLLTTKYLGVDMRPLPNVGWISSLDRPYALTRVGAS